MCWDTPADRCTRSPGQTDWIMSLSSFLSLFRRSPPRAVPTLSAGRRIIAIGDIQGFADRLDILLGMIIADLAASPPVEAEIVFLGDYIDRGPNSAAVLDRLARRDVPLPFVALRGNHEALLLEALADPAGMAHWCRSGGDATLASYGIELSPQAGGKALARARKALLERLPEQHRRFLAHTAFHHVAGPYTFVHAGLRPGVPLDQQSEDDLLWIRDAFSGLPTASTAWWCTAIRHAPGRRTRRIASTSTRASSNTVS